MQIQKSDASNTGWVGVVDGQKIAHLYLFPSGEIEYIGVLSGHRRKGYATEILRLVRAQGVEIFHSKCRTVEGDLWAESLNEEMIASHPGTCPRCM